MEAAGEGDGVSDEKSPPRWRGRVAWAALVVGCAALLAANVAIFLRVFVFDRDTFTDSVAPKDPDEHVIDAVSSTLSKRIVDNDAVQERLQSLIPQDNALVAAAVSNAADGVIRNTVRRVLESDTFRTVWRTAVEEAHDSFINLIDDDSRQPVVLNLTKFVQNVDQRLESHGISLLDSDNIKNVGEVVALRRGQIEEVRDGLNLLRRLSVVLVILAVVLLAAALVLAADRRRMLARIGVGMVIAMVVTAVALRVARHVVLGRFEVDTRREAVASLWSRVFTELTRQTVGLLVLGLVLAVGAWLAGPSASATGLRDRFRSLRHPRSGQPAAA
jgi:hypothetical protein